MKSVLLMLLLLMLTTILYLISFKSIIDREKMSPFESSWIPFSSNFFMIPVIFFIFDVELVIIMPIIMIMSNMNMNIMYIIMYVFLMILIFSLYHEWNNKMFNWL